MHLKVKKGSMILEYSPNLLVPFSSEILLVFECYKKQTNKQQEGTVRFCHTSNF